MWVDAPGAGPGSASAEDLAGHRRPNFQRYPIRPRKRPLRRPGEDLFRNAYMAGRTFSTVSTLGLSSQDETRALAFGTLELDHSFT